MDEKIKKAFQIAEHMTSFAVQKQILKEEYFQHLLHFYNGGSFLITKELINFVKTLQDLTELNLAVIVDENFTPIEIKIDEFLEQILSKYFFATNQYYTKFNESKNSQITDTIL